MNRQDDSARIHAGFPADAAGFGLAEFLISTLIIMILSAGTFTLLVSLQTSASYQTEVQSVLANTRIAMETIQHYVVQAGSNPRDAAITPLTITSATQVQLKGDLTGSAGGGQGDPDGDTLDPDEDVIIRYNSIARSIELVLQDGTVQTLANYISAFSMQYLDVNGAATGISGNVRMIRVTISGASTMANPQNRQTFGLTLTSDFKLQNLM